MKNKAKATKATTTKASKQAPKAKAKATTKPAPKAKAKPAPKAKAVVKKPKVVDGKSLVTRDAVIDMIKSIDKTKTDSTIYRYSLHYKGKDYCPRQVVRLIVEQFTDSELKHIGLRLANLIDHLIDLGFEIYDHKEEIEEIDEEIDEETDDEEEEIDEEEETDETDEGDTIGMHELANALQLLIANQSKTKRRR